MRALVRLPSALRVYGHDAGTVVVEVDASAPVPVGAVLDALARCEPAIERRIRDERGELRRHVHVFVGNEQSDLGAPVEDGAELLILPAVSGGQS